MYAKLKPIQVLGKTLETLNVYIINYSLGTSRPTLSYSITDTNKETVSQGTFQLDKKVFDNWTTNDEILLNFVAEKLNVEITEIQKITKTSEEFLKENPSLETK